LTVHEGSWHYRAFLGWERRKKRTANYYERRSLDLCRYMRTVLIYAPWRWFWQGSYSKLLCMYVWPWVVLLMLAGLGTLGWLVSLNPWAFLFWTGIAAAITLFVIAMLLASVWLVSEKGAHQVVYDVVYTNTLKGKSPRKRLANSLVWQYLKAKKHRICPLIEVEEEHV
jgi:hypothetical protein